MTHKNLTLEWLLKEQQQAEAIIKAEKQKLSEIQGLINSKLEDKAKIAFLASGKDTGTIHITEEGFDVAVEVKKTVKWDQVELLKAFDSLPIDTAKHYCSMELKIEERKYTNAPPDIQAVFLPARTVVPSAPKYTITKGE